ncbi:MAG: beta-propeller fold lactonase family protein [Mucilaginibacter sp.]|nr:beta-propeller fold lactonase family protein [Mucilaginibacter sp.]
MRKSLLSLYFLIFFISQLHAQSDQTVTNGGKTTAVNFTGNGCVYNWVNSNPSIGLPGNGTGTILPFTAVNTGVGPIIATITATPTPANLAYVTNYRDNTVSVINTADNTVLTSIAVGNAPFGTSISSDGSRVYITNRIDNTISVINTLSNTVVATIPVGTFPWGIAVTPNGKYVYVTNSKDNTVSVIDNAANSVTATINVDQNPIGVSISPDGNLAYVTCYDTGTISVINTTTNSVVSTIPVGPDLVGIVVSPDGSRIYATDGTDGVLYVVDALAGKVISTITVGDECLSIAINAAGSRIYVANQGGNTVSVIDTKNNQVTSTIPTGLSPTGVSVSPDGKSLYVTNQQDYTLSVINTSTGITTATIPTGELPISFGNFVSPAVACNGSQVTFKITVLPSPVIEVTAVSGQISACTGLASVNPNIQQFNISGTNLTAVLNAIAPDGFEISLAKETGYGSNLTLNPSAGALNNTTIYVRASANNVAGNISGNVILSSIGATDQNVAVSGIINGLPTVDEVKNESITSGSLTTSIHFTGTADEYAWTNDSPAIGLSASGSGDIISFTAINNSGSPIVATLTVTPLNSTNCNGTPVVFTITVTPTPAVAIVTTKEALPSLTTTYGTPSPIKSFTVSGTSITSGILVTAPDGFEVSSDGITFSTTTTIAGTGNIADTPIYLRLAFSARAGIYNGTLVVSSNTAASVNITIPVSTVSPAPLVITAENKTKLYGTINPVLTASYSGFVNKDGPEQLLAPAEITTTATVSSAAGFYPIKVSNAVSPDYIISYVAGVLTINSSQNDLFIPNSFTPNGDGINDTWLIQNIENYPNSTVNIFNRWGQKVFSSIGYPIAWDGSYKSRVLSTGTYYFIIDLGNGTKKLAGPITVVR